MKLLNCYLPLFRLGYEFTLYPEKYADYVVLHDTCLALIEQSTLAAEHEHAKSDCEAALLAVVIWFDEKVLCSTLPCLAQWRAAPLQMQLFQTSIGGELFFNQLDSISEENTALRRVYLFCLLAGFHGKYTQHDDAALTQRIDDAKLCLPEVWRDWPNQARLTTPAHGLLMNKWTLWKRIQHSHWWWLIIPACIYGVMVFGGIIYFS